MNSDTGKYLIFGGLLLLALGVLIYFFHDKLHWVGRLPGDIRVEKPGFRFYFPITTMIVLSAVLSFLLWLVKKFFA